MAFVRNIPLPPPSFSFAVWLNCLRGTPLTLCSIFWIGLRPSIVSAMLISPPPLSVSVSLAHLVYAIFALYSNGKFDVTGSSFFLFDLLPLPRYPSRLPLEPVSLHSCSVCAYARRPYHLCIPLSFHAMDCLDIEYADDTVLIARTQLTLHSPPAHSPT